MDIKNLLENPVLKSLLLKKLEKAWKENGLCLVTITKDKKGDFIIDTYTEEMTVISKQKFSEIINS